MAILIIVLLSLFIIFLIVVSILIGLRTKRSHQNLLQNKMRTEGVISKVSNDSNNIIMLVDFKSPTSLIGFNKRFVLSKKQHNEEDYVEGKMINLIYPKIDEGKGKGKEKKVLVFPLLIEGQKIPFNFQFFGGAIALIFATVALLVFTVISFINNDMFSKSASEVWNFLTTKNQFLLLLVVMGFFIAVQAMITILISPSRDSLYDYLKIYGIKATARVTTYKFGRAKSKGNKECHLEIEFTTSRGEKVKARLSSFLYFSSQDEYIDILYSPLDVKNVVYLRK